MLTRPWTSELAPGYVTRSGILRWCARCLAWRSGDCEGQCDDCGAELKESLRVGAVVKVRQRLDEPGQFTARPRRWFVARVAEVKEVAGGRWLTLATTRLGEQHAFDTSVFPISVPRGSLWIS